MSVELVALIVLVAVFALSAIRNVHMGALALVAALLVGVLVVGESLDDVLGGFPVDALLILLGITYLFGIARETGVVDWLVDRSVGLIGDRVALIPWAMFVIGTLVACLGTSHAAFTIVPIAMSLAHKHKIHSTMMGIVMSSAIVGGALAPTSINGITVMTVARASGIPYNPGLMFGLSVGVNTLVVLVAFFLFGGRELIARTRAAGAARATTAGGGTGGTRGAGRGAGAGAGTGRGAGGTAVLTEPATATRLGAYQVVVLVSIPVLIVGFFTITLLDVDLNLGAVALTLAVFLAFVKPDVGRASLARVDWNTILLLGGIITYVGVLTRLGAIDQLGEVARSVSSPLLAAFVICVIAGLVSAFASTIGILGALIPLAVPLLVPGGGLEMTGFIYALAISASLVDCAPFGTTGATIVASGVEEDRPRLYRHLTRWGLSMVVIGPVVTLLVFVVPFLWA
ncbi:MULTISPECIES: SLC13 family permease [unclassified Frigoribacterium]|uniref:SLC13 family permease n=1 Tax=unclassified Frigoribacterium TaxID=2627005 RepID=UPI000F46AD2B|nr:MULTISPECIES: SLC13 family permease [unclassified Frigoribacterium]ROS49311.1 UIT1 family transporter [Frigoribacterium sp. PhB118]WAC51502.1 SLC13 family permease [Frigoribacterium sp. SL97]VXA92122.1 C4-dicarboxylate ABC transporter [Frigoribacterium sp. 9N]